jgi:3-hydroxyisobutyrate dehydrogenase
MGRGIARNLDAKALLCAACDVDPQAFAKAEFSGAVMNAPADDLLDQADILLFAVPTTSQIEAFLAGQQARRPGQIVVDLTTSDPGQSQPFAVDLGQRGFGFVDAAMTGGAAGADAGTLTLMLGGSADDVATCRPALDAIAAQVFHMGPAGAGHAMKLVHNMILHSSFLATCEGLRLAERAGIDATSAVAVLNAGNARSFVTEVRFPRDILSGTMMARSRIANLEKDLGLAQEFAARLDAHIPFGSLTRSVLADAVDAGHAAKDFSWLYPLYDDLTVQRGKEE